MIALLDSLSYCQSDCEAGRVLIVVCRWKHCQFRNDMVMVVMG